MPCNFTSKYNRAAVLIIVWLCYYIKEIGACGLKKRLYKCKKHPENHTGASNYIAEVEKRR